jgi:hypothetical protein
MQPTSKRIFLIAACTSAVIWTGHANKPGMNSRWELMILDGAPEAGDRLGSLTVADIDNDGRKEIITGGSAALLWYRPGTRERGKIAGGSFHVGIAAEDIDGDGLKEIVAGCRASLDTKIEKWEICAFKPQKNLASEWARLTIDPTPSGGPHDILFADIDNDGKRELVATAMYTRTPGVFIYSNDGGQWRKFTVQNTVSAEGTVVGDLDGDRRPDIVSGPYWYKAPTGGPYEGLWKRYDLAPSFREMCRAGLVDINGDGRLDAVLNESEYPDGRLSWFENTGANDPAGLFSEHPLEQPLNFAHSQYVWRDAAGAHIFVGEMAQGGWNAPYNWDARLIRYDFGRDGTPKRELMYQGMGTHEGTMADIDGDGSLEVVGKAYTVPKVQIWKQRQVPSVAANFQHRFIDREKPFTCTDIVAADIDGDKSEDIVCGSWWYRSPDWERRDIPGIYQVINAYDLDRDGRSELIATKKSASAGSGWYSALTSELVWLKAVNPLKREWNEHPIGTGVGDWPHGNAIAPLLPGGRLALITGYHSAQKGHRPELFEIPANPAAGSWPKRMLADIHYGEELVPADLDGDKDLDIAAGKQWLENKGDGTFTPHSVTTEDFEAARVAVADVNGDSKPDIIMGEERLSYETRESFFAKVAWFENLGTGAFRMHTIDRIRCPHSIAVLDIDRDGVVEVLAGEHDPFKPYRSRNHTYVYKRADPKGLAWYRNVIDDRFEHHDGLKPIALGPGRVGIMSHGWAESMYLHLWEAPVARNR